MNGSLQTGKLIDCSEQTGLRKNEVIGRENRGSV